MNQGGEGSTRRTFDTHEQRFLRDLTKLQARVTRGRLRAPAKVHEALGRLKERYPRVARYYALAYDDETRAVTWTTQAELKTRAEHLIESRGTG